MLQSFQYYNPTRIVFGRGVVERLGETTAEYGKRVLLVSGQSSARSLGLYDHVKRMLLEQGLQVFELSGVLPNPRLSTCKDGAEICKSNHVDVLVAIGGGSVIDSAKAIAIGALDNGDLWDFFEKKRSIAKALPIITVVTIAGTGSEYNRIAVIKNEELHKKDAIWDEHVYPKVSFLDPELTRSVPARYLSYGGVDMISHALETYITGKDMPLLQLRLKEALILTVMESVERARKDPSDVEARGYLMWGSSLACSQILNVGNGDADIPAHVIETEMGGFYDTPHGAGLAVILPAVMKCGIKRHQGTLVRFAEQVMKVQRGPGESDGSVAEKGIETFRRWLKGIECPITLKELGLKENDLERIAAKVAANPLAHMSEPAALAILKAYYD